MRVSLSWLNEFVDTSKYTPQELAAKLTSAGLEVELIEERPYIKDIVVGHVLEAGKHPQADRLNLCRVTDGTEELQIVCGAPNVRSGIKIVLAKIGAELPGGVKISKAKLRGIESCGMLCSERELLLSDEHNGILILPDDTEVGIDANNIIGTNDTIFTFGITPNRGDCVSIYGIARDVAAVCGLPLVSTDTELNESSEPISGQVGLKLEYEEACPYYSARLVKGVKIAPSPLWMQLKLKSAGIRPINNAVDVTNYVMFEQGQPLHAFDRKFVGQDIIVRHAKDGERVITLDGKERILDGKTVVIADETKVVALGGVMGSEDSGINDSTTDIILESAYFTPKLNAYTANKLGISSDAAYRYSRGVDWGRTRELLDYAATLLTDICGGTICNGALEAGTIPNMLEVKASVQRICALIGVEVPVRAMAEMFDRLDISTEISGDEITAVIPSHRSDIVHEAGLAEEVARLYGLDKIPLTLPAVTADRVVVNTFQLARRNVRRLLAAMGFNETINYSFMERAYLKLFDDGAKLVDVLNPISKEMQTLRTQLFPGVVKALETNWNSGKRSIRLFEFAKTFEKSADKQPKETTRISIGVMGEFAPLSWVKQPQVDVFYQLKATLDNLCGSFNVKLGYETAQELFLHPGKSAYITAGGQRFGYLGALHPDIVEKLDLKAPVYIAELDFDALFALSQTNKYSYKAFSRFPATYKDISVVVGRNVHAQDMVAAIKSVSKYITDIVLFDEYSGEGIATDEHSLAYRIYFSTDDRTLADDEINPLLTKMADTLKDKLGAKLRG
ncbi:phenylalanine--tRNA ligase subunit beta [Deferribacterales bacterium RsTz2092]|nr:phenylalanine--tRNA ligase beta subunit [Deferribacterales bacterium]